MGRVGFSPETPVPTPSYAIAYVSRARRPFSSAELDELVVDASAHNMMNGVTGVLLYEDQRFFQYIEGRQSGVEQAYARVQSAKRHEILVEVFRGAMPERYFSHWNMASRQAKPGTILHLGSARWERARSSLPGHADQPEAMRQLLDFWQSANQAA